MLKKMAQESEDKVAHNEAETEDAVKSDNSGFKRTNQH